MGRSLSITCHETPYRSCVHPYRRLKGYSPIGIIAVPFWESFAHNPSTSSFVLQATRNETDGLNLKSGPALIIENGCPQSSRLTMSTEPDGVSFNFDALLTRESPAEKTET